MNPYQKVIDWLASPAGERWTRRNFRPEKSYPSLADYQTTGNEKFPAVLGMFTVKDDGESWSAAAVRLHSDGSVS